MTITNKPKEIKLRAFKLENYEIVKKNSGLLPILSKRLDKSIVKDRIMRINMDDPFKEEDLISDFQIRGNLFISGAILRIMDSKESPSIPNSLFDTSKIVISQLDNLDIDNSKIYKDHYYFLLNDKILITNLPGNTTISRFQTYINWLLEIDRGNFLFEFTPLIVEPSDIKLSEIKNIRIQDPTVKAKQINSEVSERKILRLTKELIYNLFSDVKSLQDIELEKVVTAELLIKFKRSSEVSKDEYQKILGAYMKPISDIENVTFVPRSGQPIKSSEIMEIKSVSIEVTESNKLSEPQLLLEMEKYLNEVKELHSL